MLDAIKHITDDIFFFQEDSAQVHSRLPGSAEVQVIWGDTVKRLLIAYFIGNISAKKYQNPFMCVKVMAAKGGTFFETRCNVLHWLGCRNFFEKMNYDTVFHPTYPTVLKCIKLPTANILA